MNDLFPPPNSKCRKCGSTDNVRNRTAALHCDDLQCGDCWNRQNAGYWKADTLVAERDVPEAERELYLECMSGRPMKDRTTYQDIRDGSILFWNVYMKVTKHHPLKDKPL